CYIPVRRPPSHSFLLNVPATTGFSALSLHDALPISRGGGVAHLPGMFVIADQVVSQPNIIFDGGGLQNGLIVPAGALGLHVDCEDRKSTRLNSSHVKISYAVFCLKKKKKRDSHKQTK